MEITNVDVWGLKKQLIRSGYPMRIDLPKQIFENDLAAAYNNDIKRAKNLGNAKSGSGHDCFLKGIHVDFDLTAPAYFWLQWGRYHFQDIISSQSKMHMILKMDIEKQCNQYVDSRSINIVEEYIFAYKNVIKLDPTNKKDLYTIFMQIISNIPLGFELTAGVETNYLQLKNLYYQRRNHKLKDDWGYFCDWIEGLDYFEELCLGDKK
jgi:hypothetical protein